MERAVVKLEKGNNAIVYIQAIGDDKHYSLFDINTGEAIWEGVLANVYKNNTFTGDPLKFSAQVESFTRLDAHTVEAKLMSVPHPFRFIFQQPTIERAFSSYLDRLLARRIHTETVMQHRVESAKSRL